MEIRGTHPFSRKKSLKLSWFHSTLQGSNVWSVGPYIQGNLLAGKDYEETKNKPVIPFCEKWKPGLCEKMPLKGMAV